MTLEPNDGSRPSLLTIGRVAAGELSPDAATGADPTLAAIAACRDRVTPFDPAALRARAAALPAPVIAPAAPIAANRPWVGWLLAASLAAAALVAVFAPSPPAESPPEGAIRFRGGSLQLHTLRSGALAPWGGEPLGAGAVIGFTVDATDREGAVLLSVDGRGATNVYWPEGDAPFEPLRGRGLVPLPGTLTLDDAPGEELFLVIYDEPAAAALARVEALYAREGIPGLVRWADNEPGVDAVLVPRSP